MKLTSVQANYRQEMARAGHPLPPRSSRARKAASRAINWVASKLPTINIGPEEAYAGDARPIAPHIMAMSGGSGETTSEPIQLSIEDGFLVCRYRGNESMNKFTLLEKKPWQESFLPTKGSGIMNALHQDPKTWRTPLSGLTSGSTFKLVVAHDSWRTQIEETVAEREFTLAELGLGKKQNPEKIELLTDSGAFYINYTGSAKGNFVFTVTNTRTGETVNVPTESPYPEESIWAENLDQNTPYRVSVTCDGTTVAEREFTLAEVKGIAAEPVKKTVSHDFKITAVGHNSVTVQFNPGSGLRGINGEFVVYKAGTEERVTYHLHGNRFDPARVSGGLKPETDYDVVLRNYSEEELARLPFRTQPLPPVQEVRAVAAHETATVHFNTLDEVYTYRVYLGTTSETMREAGEVHTHGKHEATASIPLTGLTQGQIYFYTVVATKGRYSSETEQGSFTTKILPYPTGLRLHGEPKRSYADIHFEPINDPSTIYQYFISENKNGTPTEEGTKNIYGYDGYAHRIEGLEAGKTYYVWVRAYRADEDAASEWSRKPLKIETPEAKRKPGQLAPKVRTEPKLSRKEKKKRARGGGRAATRRRKAKAAEEARAAQRAAEHKKDRAESPPPARAPYQPFASNPHERRVNNAWEIFHDTETKYSWFPDMWPARDRANRALAVMKQEPEINLAELIQAGIFEDLGVDQHDYILARLARAGHTFTEQD